MHRWHNESMFSLTLKIHHQLELYVYTKEEKFYRVHTKCTGRERSIERSRSLAESGHH